jgi:hypothetical protein
VLQATKQDMKAHIAGTALKLGGIIKSSREDGISHPFYAKVWFDVKKICYLYFCIKLTTIRNLETIC